MRLMLASKRHNGKGPWIAEITGTDPSVPLARRFLKGQQLAMVNGLHPGARSRLLTCLSPPWGGAGS
jgi:hypothetical protein